MAEEADEAKPLFDEVVVSFIPDEEFNITQRIDFEEAITANGGRCLPLRKDDEQIIDLDEITHIVSTHIEFPQYLAALEHGINVVKPSWVRTSLKKGKVAQPRQHSPDPSQYFQDVVVTFGDLPECDQDAIIAGVIALGGQHSSPLSKLVTHIVTTDGEDTKCAIAKDRGLSCKMVLPHWFDDCFRLGKKINERPYTFPNPEIMRTDNPVKIRDIQSSTLDGATSATPSTLPASSPPSSSPSEERKNLNAFMCKKMFLAQDLKLSDHLYKTLTELIDHGGATITDNAEEADIYIGQYRDGKDYIKASRNGAEVANLSWLYHVINRNKYSRPLGKLLHYPVPRHGIRGFENLRISVSNYTGDARMYLENLVRYSGAEFTKTMKQDNTHLITAHMHSEKCEAAQEWGINVVNHLWLEESFAKCAVQPLTNPRYTHFPARTNLGEVTGQTSFDLRRLEQTYFPKPLESPKKIDMPAEKPSARKTTSSARAVLATASVNQTDAPTPAPPDDDETEDEEIDEQPTTAKKSRGRPRKSDIATPRFKDDEKENQSPLLYSSGRASKAKALGMLHQQADDIALFQKEMKRKGGVTHSRRSANAEDFSSPLPTSPRPRKKRTSDELTYDATAMGSDLSDGETQAPTKPSKKAKHSPALPVELPPIQYKMLVSGDERWMNKTSKEAADKQKLRQLGIVLTQDPKEADLVVAPKLLRTRKFVCALANAPVVVNTSYLDSALKNNKLMDELPLLHDPENENHWDIDLAESLERAKDNQHNLLRGWTIFVTKDVKGGFDTYKDIISANGGQALLYQGRQGISVPKRRIRDDPDAGSESQNQGEDDEFDYVYLVTGDSEGEAKLWKQFREMAKKQDLEARIVKNDWILHAAMAQQIEWKEKFVMDERQVVSQRDR